MMAPTLDLLKNRSILVVDDEESIRMLLLEGLSAQGLHVDCAATAEEALGLVLRDKYDAILCDLNLVRYRPQRRWLQRSPAPEDCRRRKQARAHLHVRRSRHRRAKVPALP